MSKRKQLNAALARIAEQQQEIERLREKLVEAITLGEESILPSPAQTDAWRAATGWSPRAAVEDDDDDDASGPRGRRRQPKHTTDPLCRTDAQ